MDIIEIIIYKDLISTTGVTVVIIMDITVERAFTVTIFNYIMDITCLLLWKAIVSGSIRSIKMYGWG